MSSFIYSNASPVGMGLKWPTEIAVVRHGNSEQNAALDLLEPDLDEILRLQKVRDADIRVTPLGWWQSEETGRLIATREPYDICLVSPYDRTIETVLGIASQLPYKLRIFQEERLREKEFGILHGRTTEEIRQNHPQEFEDRERDGKYWYRLPRGENYPDVGARVHSILDKLSRHFSGKRVLVVTHQVPVKMFVQKFGHLTEAEVLALGHISNCGITRFGIDTSKHADGRMRLVQYNETAYDESMQSAPEAELARYAVLRSSSPQQMLRQYQAS